MVSIQKLNPYQLGEASTFITVASTKEAIRCEADIMITRERLVGIRRLNLRESFREALKEVGKMQKGDTNVRGGDQNRKEKEEELASYNDALLEHLMRSLSIDSLRGEGMEWVRRKWEA